MANRLKRVFSTVLCATVLFTMSAIPGTAFAETTDEPEKAAQAETQAPASENESGGVMQKQETTQSEPQEEAKAPAQESQAAVPQAKAQSSESKAKAVDTQAARAATGVQITTVANKTTFCTGTTTTLTADVQNKSSILHYSYQWSKDGQEISSATKSTYNATASGTYTVEVTEGIVRPNTFTANVSIAFVDHDLEWQQNGGYHWQACKNCNNYKSSPEEHTLTKTKKRDSTCTKAGHEAYWTCDTCKMMFSDAAGTDFISTPKEIAPKHTLNGTQRINETCTTDGQEAYWTCSVCTNKFADPAGRTEITEPVVIPAHGLTRVEAVDATCAKDGNIEYWVCSKESCGKIYNHADGAAAHEIQAQDTVIAATGNHTLQKTAKIEAACTEAGQEAYWTCSTCDKLFSDADGQTEISAPVAIPAHGLQAVAQVNATCTKDGTKAYWKCKDSSCGKLYADADGKTEINAPESIAATGHQEAWKAVGNNDGKCEKYCKTCDEVLSGPVDHVVTYTPSSTDPTKHARRCENCSTNLPLEDHEYGEFVVDTEPTCTTAGSKSKHCKQCDATTDVTAIPATGHDMKQTDAKAATCTASGNNEYYTCKTCDQVFKDEAGTTSTTAEAEVTEPIAHELTKTEAKAATCTEDGYEEYYECSVCKHIFKNKEAADELAQPIVIPATGHEFGEWKVVKEPTLEEAGMKERVCEKCDYAETEAIPALDAAKADLTSKTELNKTKETAEAKSDDSAKTGDDMNVALYSLLALLAASGAAGVAYRRRTTEK